MFTKNYKLLVTRFVITTTLIVGILVLQPVKPVFASTSWYVATTGNDANDCATTSTPCASIQAAINKATAGDTILSGTGIYTSGSFPVVYIAKSLIVSGGWNSGFTTQDAVTVIDGSNIRRCIGIFGGTTNVTLDHFTVQNCSTDWGAGVNIDSSTVTMNNITITNNNANNAAGIYIQDGTLNLNVAVVNNNYSYGSGTIYNNNGTMTIDNSIIDNNSSSYGSGIDNSGILTLTNSTVSNNKATSDGGGGIYNDWGKTATIINSQIIGNNAPNRGGGIFNNGNLSLNTSLISNNSSQDGSGGGIYSQSGNLTVTDSTFFKNIANFYGGGIYNYQGVLTISNSTFWENSVSSESYGIGGGILSVLGTLNISDSSFVENTATEGGGLNNNNGNTANLVNVTFFENSASVGGGINNHGLLNLLHTTISNNSATGHPSGGVFNAGVMNYTNSIIANSSGIDCYNATSFGTININKNNLVEANGESPNGCGTPAIADDPQLDSLANNGGLTNTMALLSGSPAIDGGDDANCPEFDQRGVKRPQGGHCDIGAYEKIVHYVQQDATGANNGSSWTDAYTDLQSALSEASSGDEIWVTAGTYKPTTDTDRTISFTLKNGVAIYGGFAGMEILLAERNPAANPTILSGDIGIFGNNIDNSYHVVRGGNSDNSAVLDGFIVTVGNADGSIPWDSGGGLYNYQSSPTLRNLIFSSNSAISSGGGIFNYQSNSSLINVTFTGNSATDFGGGVFNSNSSPTLTNVTFSNNTATDFGSGMSNYLSNPILTDVIFSGNSANLWGGGMHNGYSAPTLTNVTFSGNSASHGGGMYNHNGGNPNLTNVIFDDNSATFGGGMYNSGNNNPSLTNVTFSNNTASAGAGMYNYQNSLTLNTVTFSENTATSDGGGMYNQRNTVMTFTDVTFSGNVSNSRGGGIFNYSTSPTLTDVTFSANEAREGGGMYNSTASNLTLLNVTFNGNKANLYGDGGGMFNNGSSPSLTNVTFSGNEAVYSINPAAAWGGGIYNYNNSNPSLMNVTFSGNKAGHGGGIYNSTNSNPILINVTLSDNIAVSAGAMYNYQSSPSITNSILYGNTSGEIYNNSSTPIVTYSVIQGGYAGTGNLNLDPLLGLLVDNGGLTQTMALLPGSSAIDAGDDTNCPDTDQRGMTRPQGSQCDIGAYEFEAAAVNVTIGGNSVGTYSLGLGERTSPRYGINGGPVHVVSTNGKPIFTSQRAIYGSSFNSIVGYPGNQLTTEYWFTSLDDLGMITYLVIGNPSTTLTAHVDVYIAGNKMNPTPYAIAPGQRVFPRYGINGGPVQVVSDIPIFTSERTKYGNSFNEVLGYPANQLTTEYWFTSLDDLGMITYLVIGNPSTVDTALVDVYIAGNKMNTTPYSIAPGQRVFPRYGINGGPVQVVSTNGVPIFTSERTKYGNSFNEVLGYPGNKLAAEYWFTSLDDASMITYLVIGNPSTTLTAHVDVYINGIKQNTTPYAIAPGQRVFPRYGVNSGTVRVVSDIPIFTSERTKYQSSFNEILGLPTNQLTTDYWFTSLDDLGMATELVIAAP